MLAGPRGSNSKWHGGTSRLPASFSETTVNTQMRSETAKMGIDGELRDLPGQSSRQFMSQDYGEERHMAYDSPLTMPAYSGHGKVRVGKTSAL